MTWQHVVLIVAVVALVTLGDVIITYIRRRHQ